MIEAKVFNVVQLPPPAGKTHWSNVEIGKKVMGLIKTAIMDRIP